MKKIIFVPIDNRPVTYSLTEKIVSLNKSLELFMPERRFLGGLVESADIKEILNFIKTADNADLAVLSLDTVAYGGLVASRRLPDSYETIKSRIDELKNILIEKKQKNPDLKIFGHSSIMRISNNNENEEEKEYWNIYGKKIFSYSYYQHKSRVLKEYNCVYNQVPSEILEDYLETRKRNFDINKLYLDLISENVLDYMVYSKDDTGEFGLNVEEAEILKDEIKKRGLFAEVKTGADEIPFDLLTRGICAEEKVKILPVYANPDSINLISKYEDISIKECVKSQIETSIKNAVICENNPDIILYVNNFEYIQGDFVFRDVINNFKGKLPEFDRPFVIADVNNANGADNFLVEEILKTELSPKFLGYSGYNTSANSIGSAISIGIVSYLAKKENKFREDKFKELLALRFLDDWAYQANIRINVQNSDNKIEAFEENKTKFKPFEERIKNYIKKDFNVEYKLPWKRSFEVEVKIDGN